MSSGRYAVSISLAIIVIIFCRNNNHWLKLWTSIDSTAYFPYLPDFPFRSSIDSNTAIQPQMQTIVLESIQYPVYFANNEGSSSSGGGDQSSGDSKSSEQATDQGTGGGDQAAPEPEKKAEEPPPPEEPQQQQEPPPEERPESNIPTYNEFARFQDSSRPPDSHYPPGPGLGYRRGGSVRLKLSYLIVMWFCLVFIVFS